MARFAEIQNPLLTAGPVLSEVCFLLSTLPKSLKAFLEFWKRGGLRASFDLEAEREALCRLMAKYEAQPMSLADACLVRMSELHTTAELWTLDRDFSVYRRLGRKVIPCITPWN
jgi:uncharacterized protein